MSELDLWSASCRADPYPAYTRLRKQGAVHRVRGAMGVDTWLVTRYEHARAALADPRMSKHPRHAPEWMRQLGLVTDDAGPAGVNMLVSDPPDHTRLRKLVARAFTRRRIEALRPRVQQITDSLLDTMARHDEVDLIAALAFPLPIAVICELLGVPMQDRAEFRGWTQLITTFPLTEDGVALGRQARSHLERYIDDLIVRRRSGVDLVAGVNDQPDLVSALIVATDQHNRLTRQELHGMIQLLLVAGHETTVNLIGNGTLALLRHPDQLQLLRERPELLPSAIEELLRYDSSVERATPRFTTEDVEIDGQTIPANSVVSVVLASADRDPDHIPDPDRLDVRRSDQGHLAFGHGIHYCLGAPLARLEGQIAIGGLLQRFPNLRLAHPPDELHWRPGGAVNIIRGVQTLPLTLR